MNGPYIAHLFDRRMSASPELIVADDLNQLAKAIGAYYVAAEIDTEVPAHVIGGQSNAWAWLERIVMAGATDEMMVIVFGPTVIGAQWIQPYRTPASLLNALGDSVTRERLQSAHRAVGGLQRVGAAAEQAPARRLGVVPNRG